MSRNRVAGIIGSIMVFLLFFQSCWAGDENFEKWLKGFERSAVKQGIRSDIYQKAFYSVKYPDPKVLEKANYQPEFKTKIWDYIDARVNPLSIEEGKRMNRYYANTLAGVEQKFGISRYVLLAIWSVETNYGAVLKQPERLHYVPQALATLAYADPKRKKFGRTQLLAALKILQAGDISVEQFTGSWAGAMGHTQFIPTSYLAYGVDMDGNGRRDIWNSIPDALATAANLLKRNGWRTGKTWGYEVILPPGSKKYESETKLLGEWEKLGFKRPNGKSFPNPKEKAVLKILAGTKGPGFLMMKNFYVLKRYNNANAYALTVGLLADRLSGYDGVVQSWPRPPGSLLPAEKIELQQLLKAKGYYTGKIDGYTGKGTKEAIRQFQKERGLTVDGKVSKTVLLQLRHS